MRLADIREMPRYFDRYIRLAEDQPVVDSLLTSLSELEKAPVSRWQQVGERVYSEGKWTVKDILQHLIDTERIFVYRITAIARGEQQKLIPYDEESYARHTTANQRTIDDLLDELILVRKGTIAMFRSFNADMLHRVGRGYGNQRYCALSLGFMLAGHQRWHFGVLATKYVPLLVEG